MAGEPLSKTLVPLSRIAPSAATQTLRKVLEVGIDGLGPLPKAKTAAAGHLGRQQDVDAAIEWVIHSHTGLAGAQGFVTNLGGILTTAVTLPANIVGLAVVQVRMLAAIAHLRGYNVDDARVRTAITMALLGDELAGLVSREYLPSSPMAIATAPMHDPDLDERIAQLVLASLFTQSGGKRLYVFATKKIPLLGGGVGAVVDSYSTRKLGQFGKNAFPTRRAVLR